MVLDDYLATTTNDLQAAMRALASGDYPQLAREAHRVKGAAMLVGASELAIAATVLEQAARGADPPRVAPLLVELETAFDRLRLHIAQNA